jgi:hypothetical protein
MTQPGPSANHFILSAFDRDQWCPVLETRFHVTELDPLRTLLGESAVDDSELRQHYELDHDEMATIIAQFDPAFDPARLETQNPEIYLFRTRILSATPYLVHTGYELPLLLDGRKKLAGMYGPYPPMTFEGEGRFDHWVAKGILHREEVLEPFNPPARRWQGHRVVYYTLKGEEWRILATKLIWRAAEKMCPVRP